VKVAKNHNISDLSQEERDNIELKKEAAHLIYKARSNKIRRYNIEKAIEDKPEAQREAFRAFLNYYKGL